MRVFGNFFLEGFLGFGGTVEEGDRNKVEPREGGGGCLVLAFGGGIDGGIDGWHWYSHRGIGESGIEHRAFQHRALGFTLSIDHEH